MYPNLHNEDGRETIAQRQSREDFDRKIRESKSSDWNCAMQQNMQAGPSVPSAPDLEIPRMFEKLRGALGYQRDLADQLSQRLQPALAPVLPEAVNASGLVEVGPSTQVGMALGELLQMIEQRNWILRDILYRLQL